MYSLMHLLITEASTRDLAHILIVRKKTTHKQLFCLIIIISIDYGVFQRIRLKHSVAYMARTNHDKGIHTKSVLLNDRLNLPNC